MVQSGYGMATIYTEAIVRLWDNSCHAHIQIECSNRVLKLQQG